MSIDASRWAWQQKISPPLRKFVLVALADRAGEDHTCYPSIKRLMLDTGIGRTTIINSLDELEQAGFIKWTGDYRGTGVKVYRLIGVNGREDNIHPSPDNNSDRSSNKKPAKNESKTTKELNENSNKNSAKTDGENASEPVQILNQSKNCTSSKFGLGGFKIWTGGVQNLDWGGSKFGHRTIIEPSLNHHINHQGDNYATHPQNKTPVQNFEHSQTAEKKTDEILGNSKSTKSKSKSKQKDYLDADDIFKLTLADCKFSENDFENYPNLGDWLFENMDYQIIKDYLAIREKKLTLTGIKRSIREASIAGLTLCQALEICITTGKGWQSFTAEYYFNSLNRQRLGQNNQPNHQPTFTNQPRTFDEQGNIYATHQSNHQSSHQPHPNSTTAYAQKLGRDLAELKHELYGHPLPTHFGAING